MARFECPSCKTPLYTRRRKKCSQCGADLPDEMLLPQEKLAAIDADTEKLRQSVEKLKQEAKLSGPGFDIS